MTIKKRLGRGGAGIILFQFILPFFLAAPSSAGDAPAQSIITIKSVQLKSDQGNWLTVIEPDRQVDLLNEEAGLSFFNNGRVPPGSYINFKIVYFTDSQDKTTEVSAAEDLRDPLLVKNGSFIGAWFKLDHRRLPLTDIQEVSITLDDSTRVYPGNQVVIA